MYDVAIDGPIPVLPFDQPLALSPEDGQAVLSLLAAAGAEDVEFRAAHAYDRKGYIEVDSFSGGQNPSYRRDDDDIVVQVSMVVRADQSALYGALTSVYDRVQAADRQAEIAKREVEIAKAEQDLATAQARLDALRTGERVTTAGHEAAMSSQDAPFHTEPVEEHTHRWSKPDNSGYVVCRDAMCGAETLASRAALVESQVH